MVQHALDRGYEVSGVCRPQSVGKLDAFKGRITTESGTGQFAEVRAMLEADLRGWLPLMDVFVPEDEIAQILLEAEHLLAPYVHPDRTVAFGTSAHIVTALKP